MALGTLTGGNLVEFNAGLSASLAIIYPLGISIEGLSAQLDALLSIGLGPYQAELALQFNASLALQATLTLQVGDPTASLQLALSALAQLQAALIASLQFPPITLSLSAELSASMALAAAFAARIGLLKVAIEIALKIKLGALKLLLDSLDVAAELEAELTAGPLWAFSYGHGSAGDDLETIGGQIQALFSGGVGSGASAIGGDDTNVYGVTLLTNQTWIADAMKLILGGVPDPP